jgi:hypothetical protein
VSPWKVILATLAIFVGGLITGIVLVKTLTNSTQKATGALPPVNVLPGPIREAFVRRMVQELQLSDSQRDKVLHLVHESQERTKLLYSLIGEDVRDEMKETREAIRKELTPDQARKFDEMLRRRQRALAMRAEEEDGSGRVDAARGRNGMAPRRQQPGPQSEPVPQPAIP